MVFWATLEFASDSAAWDLWARRARQQDLFWAPRPQNTICPAATLSRSLDCRSCLWWCRGTRTALWCRATSHWGRSCTDLWPWCDSRRTRPSNSRRLARGHWWQRWTPYSSRTIWSRSLAVPTRIVSLAPVYTDTSHLCPGRPKRCLTSSFIYI